jgi:hypothetical protein
MPPIRRTRALRDDDELEETLSSRRRVYSSRNRTSTQVYFQHEAARINQSLQIGQQYGMVALPNQATGPQLNPSYQVNADPYPALPDDLPPSSHVPTSHARYHRLRWYAEARERRMAEWAKIENEAAATFLWCQLQTRNWTTNTHPSTTVPFTCVCPPSHVTKRAVDLIDISSRSIFSHL